MDKVKIKHSKNVVGCRIGNEIFIHPELYKKPSLYRAILKHELKHTDGFSLKDLSMDLTNNDLEGHKRVYYSFILKHPRTMIGLLPISKVGGHLTIDISMLIFSFLALVFFIWLGVILL